MHTFLPGHVTHRPDIVNTVGLYATGLGEKFHSNSIAILRLKKTKKTVGLLRQLFFYVIEHVKCFPRNQSARFVIGLGFVRLAV